MGHYYNTPHPHTLRRGTPFFALPPLTHHRTETSILFLLEKNHLPLSSHTLPPHADSQAKLSLVLFTSLPTHHTTTQVTHLYVHIKLSLNLFIDICSLLKTTLCLSWLYCHKTNTLHMNSFKPFTVIVNPDGTITRPVSTIVSTWDTK